MSSVLTIGGSPVALPATVLPARLHAYGKDAIPTLVFSLRGGPLPGLPDPYTGKPCTLSIGGVQVFSGDVMRMDPAYQDSAGWVLTYTAFGLRHRGDWITFTDDNTGLASAAFNLPSSTDPTYLASRAGRTVGEILTICLTMDGNSAALAAQGMGNYVGLSPPTLPASTVADLATLTLVPPAPVYIQGEKLLAALEAFLETWAPNVTLWIDPRDGSLRFLDLRTFTPHTLTLESADLVEPPQFSRDLSSCFQKVLVRGAPMVLPFLVSLSNGQLQEDFGHDGMDSATAKAAWRPSDYTDPTTSQDKGSCTCPSTTTVTVTSSDPTRSWAANHWDQTATGAHGWVHLFSAVEAGLTAIWSAPIVSNTPLSPGGTSTLTLGIALPVTTYGTYEIIGLTAGASIVYRKYKVTNVAIGKAMTSQFLGDVPFSNASGNAATLTSSPIGSVTYGPGGLTEATTGFTFDPDDGTILFFKPTYQSAGNAEPADVRALLAINAGVNQVTSPTSGFSGTSHTIDGMAQTLTVTVDQWRDPGQAATVQLYADDVLQSVEDAVVEGALRIHGLRPEALLMGQAYELLAPYATGLEGLALPCLSCALEWPQGSGSAYMMDLQLSNRRAAYSAAAFLKPDRTGLQIGSTEEFNPFESIAAALYNPMGGLEGFAQAAAYGNAALAGPDMSKIPTDPGAYLPGAQDWANVLPGAQDFANYGVDLGLGGGTPSGGVQGAAPQTGSGSKSDVYANPIIDQMFNDAFMNAMTGPEPAAIPPNASPDTLRSRRTDD